MSASIDPAVAERTCGYCGRVYDNPVRYHSGVRECGSCWNWRKLDGPMASYWTEKIDSLNENIDLYDIDTWNRMGISDEMTDAIMTLRAFRDRCEIAKNTKPGTPEWRAALGYSTIDKDIEE